MSRVDALIVISVSRCARLTVNKGHGCRYNLVVGTATPYENVSLHGLSVWSWIGGYILKLCILSVAMKHVYSVS